MTAQAQLVSVPFHGDTLFIVSHEGEPFTPVRPIVEAMGIRWQAQHSKLVADKKRWSVIMKMTETKAGAREALCIPVRKVAAFLASIDPRRVRPEIREKIRVYQAECDDALWAYWTKGRAENPRAQAKAAPSAAPLFKNAHEAVGLMLENPVLTDFLRDTYIQMDAMRQELLLARPSWARIARYRKMGLNNTEIGLLVRKSPRQIQRALLRMARCSIGAAPVKPQQPSLFGDLVQ